MIIENRDPSPAAPSGLAPLARLAFAGAGIDAPWQRALARLGGNADDTAALMDLSAIAQLCGRRADGLALQARALRRERLYRRPAANPSAPSTRLLAFMAPGDFMANTPLEFLLEGSDVTLDMLYLTPEAPLPRAVPEHDLAIVAIGESDANRPLLQALAPIVRSWERPVLNRPERIVELSRDRVWRALQSLPGIHVPTTVRVDRAGLTRIGNGSAPIETALPGESFPIIARPVGSHAGEGLAKLDGPTALAAYLGGRAEAEFYIAPFVDYRGSDGLFRKYRLALIGGRPFACHMAISSHWMIHYLNAGMDEDAAKRAEEARFMADFDGGFAARHDAALRSIAERMGLDYVALDCGEMPDGRLLVFEIDVAMIVHSMDPPDLFPYKAPQMLKVFDAFRGLLRARSGRTEAVEGQGEPRSEAA